MLENKYFALPAEPEVGLRVWRGIGRAPACNSKRQSAGKDGELHGGDGSQLRHLGGSGLPSFLR